MKGIARFSRRSILALLLAVGLMLALGETARTQQGSSNPSSPVSQDSFTFKVYATNYAFYPFVSCYFRTFNATHEPLTNLNIANVGLMVKGRAYGKNTDMYGNIKSYGIESLQNRNEAFRTVFVWDCSKTMEGQPFRDARAAIMKFIEAKRDGDEVAILAIRDTKEGYQLVSNFEKNRTMLFQRIEDVKCDGMKTRLYDSIHKAMEMCFDASEGGINAGGAEYIVLSSIVVLSDGKDEGSAMDRSELVSQLNLLKIPIPIMSLAYSQIDKSYFKNLEALSKATLGSYWTVEETADKSFAALIQKIHEINRQDYVVTFRVYDIPVDGEKHNFKIALTYPSNSGKMRMDEGVFEALDSSPFFATPRGQDVYKMLNGRFPAMDLTKGESPYMANPAMAMPPSIPKDGFPKGMTPPPSAGMPAPVAPVAAPNPATK